MSQITSQFVVFLLVTVVSLFAGEASAEETQFLKVASLQVGGENVTFHDFSGDGLPDLFVGMRSFGNDESSKEDQLWYLEAKRIRYIEHKTPTRTWNKTMFVPPG